MRDCFRLKRLVHLATALFIAAGALGCATTQSTGSTSASGRPAPQAEKSSAQGQLQSPVYQGSGIIAYYPAPRRIDFCGEAVPLDHQEVLERFDKEFTLLVYNHAQVYRWLKRRERYFPWIEERLRRLNLPEDLKYIALWESEPPLNAPERRRSADARYDFERSPDSAFLYLGDLYRNFNSWSLALAAYNGGEETIMDQFRAQGVSDAYQMILPQQTERYVFRVLAIKAVLSDPTRYGYELPQGAGNP